MRRALSIAAVMVLCSVAAQAAEHQAKQAAPAAPAADPTLLSSCLRLYMPPGSRQVIEANINIATRIQFPGKVTNVSNATPALWDDSHAEDSVWIRPTINADAAKYVGLSVFTQGEAGGAAKYDFIVVNNQSTPGAPSCVIVSDSPLGAQAAKAQSQATAATIARLSGELAQEQQRYEHDLAVMRSQVEQQARDKIKAFEYSVYTRYDWNGEGQNTDDKNLISAVYDDGRNTYVRISTTAFGLPSITGALEDKDITLQSEYDDLTGVYTIRGLLDQLRVRLGNHVINIRRLG